LHDKRHQPLGHGMSMYTDDLHRHVSKNAIELCCVTSGTNRFKSTEFILKGAAATAGTWSIYMQRRSALARIEKCD
jgi:hypothetical protein